VGVTSSSIEFDENGGVVATLVVVEGASWFDNLVRSLLRLAKNPFK